MTTKEQVHTEFAPQAIGTYSQGIRSGNLLFISGQIPVDPITGDMTAGSFANQVEQVLLNIKAVCEAAGGSLDQITKLSVYLTDLNNFQTVNEVMEKCLQVPYPARAAVEVSRLPKDVAVEMDAIAVLD